MKIRKGFVSNSSSSSFIIRKSEKTPDILTLSKNMIAIREFGNEEEMFKKIEERRQVLQNIKNISFNSCNYETFISEMGNFFVVSTCNNHDWDKLDEDLIYDHEVVNEEGFSLTYDYEYDIKSDNDFYYIEYDVYGRPSSQYKYCSECYTEYWDIDDISQCPSCRKDRNGSTAHLKTKKRKEILTSLKD